MLHVELTETQTKFDANEGSYEDLRETARKLEEEAKELAKVTDTAQLRRYRKPVNFGCQRFCC